MTKPLDLGATFPYSLPSLKIKQSSSIIEGGRTIWMVRGGSADTDAQHGILKETKIETHPHPLPFSESHKNKYFWTFQASVPS